VVIHFPSGYNRDPSGFKVRYLFPDAFYEGLKGWFGIKEAVLCAWGIMTDGCKILLHLDLGRPMRASMEMLTVLDAISSSFRLFAPKPYPQGLLWPLSQPKARGGCSARSS